MSKLRFALVTAALLLISGFASAGEPERIIVFGDSMSDTGNTFLATGESFPPSPPYFFGRFSDGPLWVEYLAEDIGAQPPSPSLLSGSNYAWGGAESVDGPSTVGVPGVGAQVTEYLGTVAGIADPDALYVVWAGVNDILAGEDARIVAANIADAVERLADAGAKQILVANMMNLGLAPALQAGFDPFYNPNAFTADQFRAASIKFNISIRLELRRLQRANRHAEIRHLNTARVLRQIVRRPSRFGIQNVTDAAIGTGNSNTSLWWDTIHPTTIFHRALADSALRVLDGDDDHDEDNDDHEED